MKVKGTEYEFKKELKTLTLVLDKREIFLLRAILGQMGETQLSPLLSASNQTIKWPEEYSQLSATDVRKILNPIYETLMNIISTEWEEEIKYKKDYILGQRVL